MNTNDNIVYTKGAAIEILRKTLEKFDDIHPALGPEIIAKFTKKFDNLAYIDISQQSLINNYNQEMTLVTVKCSRCKQTIGLLEECRECSDCVCSNCFKNCCDSCRDCCRCVPSTEKSTVKCSQEDEDIFVCKECNKLICNQCFDHENSLCNQCSPLAWCKECKTYIDDDFLQDCCGKCADCCECNPYTEVKETVSETVKEEAKPIICPNCECFNYEEEVNKLYKCSECGEQCCDEYFDLANTACKQCSPLSWCMNCKSYKKSLRECGDCEDCCTCNISIEESGYELKVIDAKHRAECPNCNKVNSLNKCKECGTSYCIDCFDEKYELCYACTSRSWCSSCEYYKKWVCRCGKCKNCCTCEKDEEEEPKEKGELDYEPKVLKDLSEVIEALEKAKKIMEKYKGKGFYQECFWQKALEEGIKRKDNGLFFHLEEKVSEGSERNRE